MDKAMIKYLKSVLISYKLKKLLFRLIILLLVLYIFNFAYTTTKFTTIYLRDRKLIGVQKCSREGRLSGAPINHIEFAMNLHKAILILLNEGHQNIVYTTANAAAATYNLEPFLISLSSVLPPMNRFTVIMCLDNEACSRCRQIHIPYLCVYMNLGVGKGSLAPKIKLSNGSHVIDTNNYWRLTFGRYYAPVLIMERFQVSVTSVDIDSIFLKNPFASGQVLYRNPNIAVAADSAPYHIDINDNTIINGGFFYLPALNWRSWKLSNEVVSRVWSFNCKPRNISFVNDQDIISLVLRNTLKYEKSKQRQFQITHLPMKLYRNYCNTDCGGKYFKYAYTLKDLMSLEKNKSSFNSSECGLEERKNWVFFHTCCIPWPENDHKKLALAKGLAQRGLYEWLQQSTPRE